ncbi:hypothetical protein, conserved [Angomonas deanei]|uniref:C3H1-type domain-containing protein n=1 Tax=Angomonas deanei TaxID=59799 RepID=A0A7G2CC18_9TRYP|nr:hypothetical protein, conserved [Angomonas deanei]
MTSPQRFTHNPYAPLKLSPIQAETAATPLAPLDPEALLRSQQDNYRECSFRTQRCTRYDEETKSCPLGNRCYYYHTRKGKEHKRTFDMNRDCHLCTSDDVERWLDRQARKNQQRHTPAGNRRTPPTILPTKADH